MVYYRRFRIGQGRTLTPEYLNGVRITKHYYEMDPLEAAISRFEAKAPTHYALENKTHNLTAAQRKAQLKTSLAHLEAERRHLKSISSVRTQLAMYRKEGEKVFSKDRAEAKQAVRMLQSESHHPTAELEKYMRAENVPKPSPHHTAHHILPGKGQYRQMEIAAARLHMHMQSIRINNPANGVYLVSVDKNTPHWSMPNSRGHLKYHTEQYEAWVAMKVQSFVPQDLIKTQLQLIGRILQQNEPKSAFAAIAALR